MYPDDEELELPIRPDQLLDWALDSIHAALFETPGSVRAMNALATAYFLVQRAATQLQLADETAHVDDNHGDSHEIG